MDPFIGEIKMVSFGFAPQGWAMCDGQILPIMQNPMLFSVIGTTYGGDGFNYFFLPDFRGKAPLHFNAEFPIGHAGGEAGHTLTPAEMPSHKHSVYASNASENTGLPMDAVWSNVTEGYADTPAVPMHSNALGVTGGQPHENRQPFLVLNFVIALQGLFPSRD
jgi:microcystin-dependent protein